MFKYSYFRSFKMINLNIKEVEGELASLRNQISAKTGISLKLTRVEEMPHEFRGSSVARNMGETLWINPDYVFYHSKFPKRVIMHELGHSMEDALNPNMEETYTAKILGFNNRLDYTNAPRLTKFWRKAKTLTRAELPIEVRERQTFTEGFAEWCTFDFFPSFLKLDMTTEDYLEEERDMSLKRVKYTDHPRTLGYNLFVRQLPILVLDKIKRFDTKDIPTLDDFKRPEEYWARARQN